MLVGLRIYPLTSKPENFLTITQKKQGLPTDPDFVRYIEEWAKTTFIVPPRIDKYIEINMEIQRVFQDYGSPNEIYPYSTDEGFIDLTTSLDYFVNNQSISRKDKLDMISAKIQKDIWRKTGIYSTVGMSNSSPLLAKLALDNEAKKMPTMRANWSYEDVERKVWAIPNMTDFLGIGHRMEKRLNDLGNFSIKELANSNPDLLKKSLGVVGLRLWFYANRVDESNVNNPYKPKSKGLGNSQVLPRDYVRQRDIEIVLREMAEQVAICLRRAGKKTTVVSIHVGYSKQEIKNQSTHKKRSNQLTRRML